MNHNNDNGEMSSLEFACYAIFFAGIMYFADIWISEKFKKPEVKQVVQPMKPLTRAEKAILCTGWDKCTLLSEVIVYEARGEPIEGKRMVAKVVLNRVEHPSWPDTLKEVVYEPKQFSYLSEMHKQRKPEESDWTEARAVAYNVLHGGVEVDTDATFYHERSVKPFWAKHKELVASVGNHKFYEGGK